MECEGLGWNQDDSGMGKMCRFAAFLSVCQLAITKLVESLPQINIIPSIKCQILLGSL